MTVAATLVIALRARWEELKSGMDGAKNYIERFEKSTAGKFFGGAAAIKTINGITAATKELIDAVNQGQSAWESLGKSITHAIESVPVAGNFVGIGQSIREAVTGDKAALDSELRRLDEQNKFLEENAKRMREIRSIINSVDPGRMMQDPGLLKLEDLKAANYQLEEYQRNLDELNTRKFERAATQEAMKLIETLRIEIQTWGMAADAAERYRLTLDGVGDQWVDTIETLQTSRRMLEMATQAMNDLQDARSGAQQSLPDEIKPLDNPQMPERQEIALSPAIERRFALLTSAAPGGVVRDPTLDKVAKNTKEGTEDGKRRTRLAEQSVSLLRDIRNNGSGINLVLIPG